MLIIYAVLFLTASSHARPISPDSTVDVASCAELYSSLKRASSDTRLFLTQSIECNLISWPSPISVTTDVTLDGGFSKFDVSRLNLSEVFVVHPNGRLVLDSLLLFERTDTVPRHETSGLSFVRLSSEASVSILRSYVIYPSCPKRLQLHGTRMEVETKEGYEICGTRRLCAEEMGAGRRYRLRTGMKRECQFLDAEAAQYDALYAANRPISTVGVLIALSGLVIVFAVMGVVITYLCRRSTETNAKVLETYYSEDHKTETDSDFSQSRFSLALRIAVFDDFSIDLDQQLGVGGYGTVFAGRIENQTAAVKVIKLADQPEGKDTFEEANLAMGFVHPNVIRTYAFRQVTIKDLFGEHHPQGEDACTLIFSEYCDKGELSRAIDRGEYVQNFESLEPKMCAILHCALDIAKGLQYLHSIGVVHGDIKPDNILRKSDLIDPRGYTCKACRQIGDFGLSKRLDTFSGRTENPGVISYMPPEMLRKGRLGKFTDIYSFGMLLWEMVTSDVPYSEVDYNQILSEAIHGRRPIIPESTPSTIQSLIKSCWTADYTRRPIAAEVVSRLNLALAEWYACFPMEPSISSIPRWLRGGRRSVRSSNFNSTLYPESLYSDTALEEREDRGPLSLLKTHTTCFHSECTAPDLQLGFDRGMELSTAELDEASDTRWTGFQADGRQPLNTSVDRFRNYIL